MIDGMSIGLKVSVLQEDGNYVDGKISSVQWGADRSLTCVELQDGSKVMAKQNEIEFNKPKTRKEKIAYYRRMG